MFNKRTPFVEILSVVLAVPGAILLAINVPESKYAYPLFLGSNLFALILFIREKRSWFLLQTVVYFIINTIGFYRWIL